LPATLTVLVKLSDPAARTSMSVLPVKVTGAVISWLPMITLTDAALAPLLTSSVPPAPGAMRYVTPAPPTLLLNSSEPTVREPSRLMTAGAETPAVTRPRKFAAAPVALGTPPSQFAASDHVPPVVANHCRPRMRWTVPSANIAYSSPSRSSPKE
jgi:hypothetical protein